MRYHPINSQLFESNRQNLYKHLKPNALVICNSNDIMPSNADGMMPFRQNNDLL
ncbi:MAG: aminopeptidase P N-terminal domain-containing protein, partial [Bacteroidota bacterium]